MKEKCKRNKYCNFNIENIIREISNNVETLHSSGKPYKASRDIHSVWFNNGAITSKGKSGHDNTYGRGKENCCENGIKYCTFFQNIESKNWIIKDGKEINVENILSAIEMIPVSKSVNDTLANVGFNSRGKNNNIYERIKRFAESENPKNNNLKKACQDFVNKVKKQFEKYPKWDGAANHATDWSRSLADDPILMKRWDFERNNEIPEEYVFGQHIDVYLICLSCGESTNGLTTEKRKKSKICGVCNGKVKSESNKLVNDKRFIGDHKEAFYKAINQNNELAIEMGKKSIDEIYTRGDGNSSNIKWAWACLKNTNHDNYLMDFDHKFRPRYCPQCSGKGNVPYEDSILYACPDIDKVCLDKTKEELRNIRKGSGIRITITCRYCAEEWKPKSAYDIYKNWNVEKTGGCGYCNNKIVSSKNNLEYVAKQKLVPLWIEEFKEVNDIDPKTVIAQSMDYYDWFCFECKKKWPTTPKYRFDEMSECGICHKMARKKSTAEYVLNYELGRFFKNVSAEFDKPKGVKYGIDCYIPELELIIQFNGHYFHKDKAAKDLIRHKQISSAGYKVIWIHENFDENRRISPYDIFISTQRNKVFDSRYDEMINKVLLKINEMYPNRIESNVINQCLENKYKLQNLYIANKEHELWKKRDKSKRDKNNNSSQPELL